MFTLRSRQSGFALHIVLIVLVAVGAVIAIGLYTKNQADISKQRQQFIAAETEVTALGEEIAQATNPNMHESEAYCSYSGAKPGQGTRHCWSKYYLLYENTNENSALTIFTEVEKVVSKTKKYSIEEPEYLASLKALTFQSAHSDVCSVAVYYNKTQVAASAVPSFDQPANSSSVVVSCSAEAKADFFPVKD